MPLMKIVLHGRANGESFYEDRANHVEITYDDGRFVEVNADGNIRVNKDAVQSIPEVFQPGYYRQQHNLAVYYFTSQAQMDAARVHPGGVWQKVYVHLHSETAS